MVGKRAFWSAESAGSTKGEALRLESEPLNRSLPWLGELPVAPLEHANIVASYGKRRAIASEFSKKSNRKLFVKGRASNNTSRFDALSACFKKMDSLLFCGHVSIPFRTAGLIGNGEGDSRRPTVSSDRPLRTDYCHSGSSVDPERGSQALLPIDRLMTSSRHCKNVVAAKPFFGPAISKGPESEARHGMKRYESGRRPWFVLPKRSPFSQDTKNG